MSPDPALCPYALPHQRAIRRMAGVKGEDGGSSQVTIDNHDNHVPDRVQGMGPKPTPSCYSIVKEPKKHQRGRISLSRSPRLCTDIVPSLRSHPHPVVHVCPVTVSQSEAFHNALASASTKG